MKLRMEIIDQRSKAIEPFEAVRTPKPESYADLWAQLMSMGIKPAESGGPAIVIQPTERPSKKAFDLASAPDWGTKEWFYNTSIQAKVLENQYTDAYGQVHRWSAFT